MVRIFSLLFFFCLSLSASWADGLVVPRSGGLVILDSQTLAVQKELSFGSGSTPQVALHPSQAVLAAASDEEGLVFWNLPGFSEASRHKGKMFGKVKAIDFSPDGKHVYLLNSELGAVVVFELASSTTKGLIPIPGGEASGLKVTERGILLQQKHGSTLLSFSAKEGLVAQFRYPESQSTSLVSGDRLYVALEGVSGYFAYQLSTGRTLGFVQTSAPILSLLKSTTSSVIFSLTSSGRLEARTPGQGEALWSFGTSSTSFDSLLSNASASKVYAVDYQNGIVLGVETTQGREMARSNLGGPLGRAVFVP